MQKTKRKNKTYLFIDYGNTNIKAGIYHNDKLTNINFIKNTLPAKQLLNKFNKKDLNKIDKIVVVSTTNKLDSFINQINKVIKAEVKVIGFNDFKGLLDFSNIDKKVVIGNDLLLLGLYASKTFNKGAIFCLGTVYSAVIMNNKQFKSVLFVPSIAKAIDNIPNITSIPSSLIPSTYDKTIGLNTKDCLSSGANLLLEGYVDNVVNAYKLQNKNVLITGGDSPVFLNLNKKYKVIDNLTLKSISLLVKEKCW